MNHFPSYRSFCIFAKVKNLIFYAVFAILFQLFFANKVAAQGAVFSQYYASSLYLNPALAGLQPDISVSANYRMQWLNVNPYTTGQVSLIYPFLNKNKPSHEHWGGAGLSVFQDNAGSANAVRSTGANFNFAYNLNLSDQKINVISFGLQGGFVQRQLNSNNYAWGTQYTTGSNQIDDGSNQQNIINQKISPTVAGGAVWYFANTKEAFKNSFKAFAGISGYQLNRPNRAMLDNQTILAPILLKFHAGISLPISQRISLSPNAIVALQNNLQQINAGGYFSFLLSENENGFFARPEFIAGGWYRLGDAIIFNTGLSTSHFSIGLSYDLNSSTLDRYTNSQGAYEISLSIKMPRGVQQKRYATPRI